MPKELVEVVRCKDCIHRPQWNKTVLAPPNYWGESESDIDWTCPLIDKTDTYNSWYMPDDFFCPKGETREDIEAALAELEKGPLDKCPRLILEIDRLRLLLENSEK